MGRRIIDLEEQLDSTQQYAMKNHLIVDAIPETANENTQDIVIKACKKVNVTISDRDFQRSHRLGPKSKDKIRPIIVHFSNIKTKKQIITAVKDDLFSSLAAARNQRRSTVGIKPRIRVREHLTKKRASFLRDLVILKKDKLIQSVWTEDGVVIVRIKQDERLYRIQSESDYDNFIKKIKPQQSNFKW